ncbi:hypothetical protein BDV96DRAFT_654416 [Lophiotrema nucula]|uniref:Uncharacterized protein n=1 Tax=Lophiotrema nucula TaxID=690887 RepID=A0A6A5YIH8_9PLEO|nr:hypothetical protein BDV96DRAFT_654416 [Lophiotrema nucula]
MDQHDDNDPFRTPQGMARHASGNTDEESLPRASPPSPSAGRGNRSGALAIRSAQPSRMSRYPTQDSMTQTDDSDGNHSRWSPSQLTPSQRGPRRLHARNRDSSDSDRENREYKISASTQLLAEHGSGDILPAGYLRPRGRREVAVHDSDSESQNEILEEPEPSGLGVQFDHSKYAVLARDIESDGFLPIIQAAWRDEIDSGSSFGEGAADDFNGWRDSCDVVLCSMDQDSILHIMAGNLTRAYLASKATDGSLARTLDKYEEWANNGPSIYIRPLADIAGGSLTLDDLEQIIVHLQKYLDPMQTDWAFQIDLQARLRDGDSQEDVQRDVEANRRFFFKTNTSNNSSQRRIVLRRFIAALQGRLQECRQNSTLLEPPLQYVGYAIRASQRRDQHFDLGKSTCWLSTFLQLVCDKLWPGKYSFGFLVICPIVEEDIGAPAEILLTWLSRSYFHAGGLSVGQAGGSTTSLLMHKLSQAARLEFWKDCQDWMLTETDHQASMKLELGRRRELVQRQLAIEEAQVESEFAQVESEFAQVKFELAQIAKNAERLAALEQLE